MRLLLLLSLSAGLTFAQAMFQPPETQGVGIDARLNAQLPLDVSFHDETGATVPLRSFFHSKPVLIAPVYFTCPMLCSQILSGVVAGLRPLSLIPGRDFEVVALSFDPNDKSDAALRERDHYSSEYSSRLGPQGWHFLTGDSDSIHKVMSALGFRYRWDPIHKMFIHASGVVVATPEGQVSRYLYGVNYEPKDLKLSLVDASQDRIGTVTDQILLLCYHYDPKTGKYGATVITLLRGAGVLTILTFIAGLAFFWRKDLRTYKTEARL